MNLHDETRSLVHKGHLKCVTLKRIHYFLFNDVLLLTKQQGDKHKLLFQIDLVDATMEAVIGDASAGSSFSLQFPFLSHPFLHFLSRFFFYFPQSTTFFIFRFQPLQYFHVYALLCWYFNISGLLSFGLLPFGLPSRFYSLHIRCCFTTLGLEGKFGNERKLIYFFLPFFFKIKRQDPRTLRINVSHGKITV